MIRVKNKVFKELRGVWLYDALKSYVKKLAIAKELLDPSFRFTKIMDKTITTLKTALKDVEQNYEDACSLFDYFQQIRGVLGEEKTSREEKVSNLHSIYDEILAMANKRDSTIKLEECKAFLPSKKKLTPEIMGEWCRLWKSYLPGLFEYYKFPKPIRTNMELERMLSKEKQATFNRVAKANMCRIVAMRGENYLRIMHCSPEVLQSNIIEEYLEEIVKQLSTKLASDIKAMTEITRTRSLEYEKFDMDIKNTINWMREKKEVTILSAKTNLLLHKKKKNLFFYCSYFRRFLSIKTIIILTIATPPTIETTVIKIPKGNPSSPSPFNGSSFMSCA